MSMSLSILSTTYHLRGLGRMGVRDVRPQRRVGLVGPDLSVAARIAPSPQAGAPTTDWTLEEHRFLRSLREAGL